MDDNAEARFIAVETALATQEKMLEDLNAVVIEQGKLLEKLSQQNRYLLETLHDNDIKPLSEETPPPHY